MRHTPPRYVRIVISLSEEVVAATDESKEPPCSSRGLYVLHSQCLS